MGEHIHIIVEHASFVNETEAGGFRYSVLL